jgi:hypothetical protein
MAGSLKFMLWHLHYPHLLVICFAVPMLHFRTLFLLFWELPLGHLRRLDIYLSRKVLGRCLVVLPLVFGRMLLCILLILGMDNIYYSLPSLLYIINYIAWTYFQLIPVCHVFFEIHSTQRYVENSHHRYQLCTEPDGSNEPLNENSHTCQLAQSVSVWAL